MNKYLIRFNKSRGQPGRGTDAHVWRVFENEIEYLAAEVKVNVPSWSEQSEGPDWNIACNGFMQIDHDTGTVTISKELVAEIKPKRTCDSCTKCCQGHLWDEAHGHTFQSGKPCFFVGEKGCSIYADRPKDPCVSFKCEWLAGDYLPMWMRPDLSKVIVTKRVYDDGEWLEVCEAGQKMDSAVLSWLLIWAKNNNKNIRYQIDSGWNWIKNSER
jgi:uncharacterized cysteine cluster protein YcgN (CxxCxxCC family)